MKHYWEDKCQKILDLFEIEVSLLYKNFQVSKNFGLGWKSAKLLFSKLVI